MHLFDRQHPFSPSATLVHDTASVEDYHRLKERLGIERCVVVQPSSYGHDHTVLLDGLRHWGDQAKGIAVIVPNTPEHVLEELNAKGVVGVRFNLVQRGATDETMLAQVAGQVERLEWHIQLHVLARDFLRLARQLPRLKVPIVLDHLARVGTEKGLEKQVKTEVLNLLGTGMAWIKLSGAYIASDGSPEFSDLDAFVCEVLDRYPERVVWGSDWPHVTEVPKPNDASLLNLLARWAPEQSLREQILVTNPKGLYKF